MRRASMLYLVATPIGNLEDITLRALRVLGEVDLIACEDTRRARKLLAHYRISKPLISYHEHNERARARELIEKLESGARIALISDAGMPLISDPGFKLVSEAIRRGIKVIPVPGPSAAVAALAASGLPANEFTFVGFLPRRSAERRARLAQLSELNSTLVIFEAPHRIKSSLQDALTVFGDRPAALAREMTKLHEEFIRGSLSEIAQAVAERQPRGEFVLIIGPPQRASVAAAPERSILEEVEELIRGGLDQKAALKEAARSRGIPRAQAYRMLVAEKRAREIAK